MSQYEEYRASRTTFGIDVLGSIFIKIRASNGVEGIATGKPTISLPAGLHTKIIPRLWRTTCMLAY